MQGCNQWFFRAGKVFWNKGTSVNISSTTHKRKPPQGKISQFLFLRTLKAALMKNLTQHIQVFFSKTRPIFFLKFQKGKEDLLPHSPTPLYLCSCSLYPSTKLAKLNFIKIHIGFNCFTSSLTSSKRKPKFKHLTL